MPLCYELVEYNVVPPSSVAWKGASLYPVNVDVADCMTAAAHNPWGYPISGHIVGLSSADYEALNSSSLQTLFENYFLFDPDVFMQIIGGSLVAYALGHMTGAVVKLMMTKPTLDD